MKILKKKDRSLNVLPVTCSFTYLVHFLLVPGMKNKAEEDAHTVWGQSTPGLDKHIIPIISMIHTAPGCGWREQRRHENF